MSDADSAPTPETSEAQRLVLEFPLEAGEAWLERVQQVAAPLVLRLGQIERPDKLVIICELEPERRDALLQALREAWQAHQGA